VTLLALKFHWSRADILALPIAEFDYYIKTLSDLSQPDPN
jgi:hypothetical protein